MSHHDGKQQMPMPPKVFIFRPHHERIVSSVTVGIWPGEVTFFSTCSRSMLLSTLGPTRLWCGEHRRCVAAHPVQRRGVRREHCTRTQYHPATGSVSNGACTGGLRPFLERHVLSKGSYRPYRCIHWHVSTSQRPVDFLALIRYSDLATPQENIGACGRTSDVRAMHIDVRRVGVSVGTGAPLAYTTPNRVDAGLSPGQTSTGTSIFAMWFKWCLHFANNHTTTE